MTVDVNHTYNGDGVTSDFAVPFDYDHNKPEQVVVTWSGGTPVYTFTNPGLIHLTTPSVLGVGQTLNIQRVTPSDELAGVYKPGSSYPSSQLNASLTQLLRIAQEVRDYVTRSINSFTASVNNAVSAAAAASTTANNASAAVTALAPTVSSGDAATLASAKSYTDTKVASRTYTKADVGLGNVDNTSDTSKPVSTAQATAIAAAQASAISTSEAYTDTKVANLVLDAGAGDVAGPGSSIDGHAVVFDGATGKKIKDGGALFSGSYTDLTNKPTLFSGNYSDLIGRPTLFSGSYTDLTNKPSLATVATTGSYTDLLGKPTLFSGAYSDLTGKPTLGSSAANDVATAAQFRSATSGKMLDASVWSAAGTVALSDGTTISMDLSSGLNFTLTLGGNHALGNPTNQKVGQSGFVRITNSGGNTLSFGTNWVFDTATAPSLATGLNVLGYAVLASGQVFGWMSTGVG